MSDFSKKTGDYRSLSATDIKVLALVYQLEKECVGTEHIKTEPEKKEQWTAGKQLLERPTAIAGFYLDKRKNNENKSRTSSESTSSEITEQIKDIDIQDKNEPVSENNLTPTEESITKIDIEVKDVQSHDLDSQSKDIEKSHDLGSQLKDEQESHDQQHRALLGEGDVIPEDSIKYDDDDSEEEEDEEEEDGGWITPNNIKQVRAQMGDKNVEKADVTVGCLTTDFAMQNVLIQMGLNVVSVDGMLIKRAKSYVLRCFGCFKITTVMTKEFCPTCGNKTLQKISMSVDDNGMVHYHLSTRKQMTTRGMKYSLPAPRGGKHAKNPILCEDQLGPQQKPSKASKSGMNVFSSDYVANSSPFALKDTTSRAAMLGIHGNRKDPFSSRRNPNESRKRQGRRK